VAVFSTLCRPDFLELAQCQPLTPTTLGSEPLVIGQSGSAARAAFPCRASDKTVRDARQAFVSGAFPLVSGHTPHATSRCAC